MVLHEIILFAQNFVNAYGLFGTFIIAVLESFIFPVPTAVIITPSTALGLDPLITTIIATTGSVLGAVIGYMLGKTLGHPVALKLFKEKHVKGVEKWFDKYGAYAVLIAAFTPIPFKVFTWSAGIFEMEIKRFLLAAIVGRFAQFVIAAYVGSVFGPEMISFFTLF